MTDFNPKDGFPKQITVFLGRQRVSGAKAIGAIEEVFLWFGQRSGILALLAVLIALLGTVLRFLLRDLLA